MSNTKVRVKSRDLLHAIETEQNDRARSDRWEKVQVLLKHVDELPVLELCEKIVAHVDDWNYERIREKLPLIRMELIYDIEGHFGPICHISLTYRDKETGQIVEIIRHDLGK